MGKEASKSLGTTPLHTLNTQLFAKQNNFFECKSQICMILQKKVRRRMVKQENSDTGSFWSEMWGSPPRDQNNGNATTSKMEHILSEEPQLLLLIYLKHAIYLLCVCRLLYCRKSDCSQLMCTDRGRSIREGQESGSCCQTVARVLKTRRRQASNTQTSRGSGQQRLVQGSEMWVTMSVQLAKCTLSLFVDVGVIRTEASFRCLPCLHVRNHACSICKSM